MFIILPHIHCLLKMNTNNMGLQTHSFPYNVHTAHKIHTEAIESNLDVV